MKKKLLKFFIIMVAICLTLILLSTTRVQGAIQSNANTHYKNVYAQKTLMTNFRNMETIGGALGLTETVNTTTMVATSESNNLDSHMMKSTEYGAIAILSASGYGNPTTLQKSTIKTTTGNETGLYYDVIRGESVAGGMEGYIFSGVDARYYDAYRKDNTSAKIGDALGTADTTNPGCAGWHSAFFYDWANSTYIKRGASGLFSVTFQSDSRECGRGVVVCGAGL